MTPNPTARSRAARSLTAAAVAAAALLAACSSGSGHPPSGPPATSGGGSATSASSATSPASRGRLLPAALASFGSYRAVPLTDPDAPAYRGPAAPTSLTGVRAAEALRPVLDKPGVSATLARQGFVVVPAGLQQLQFGYQGSSYEGWPVYVTTDAAYHVWHQTFDAVLRTTEEKALAPRLRTLLEQTLPAARAQAAELAGTPLADAAARAEQLYQVAAAELGVPVTLGDLATQEKALVDKHAGTATSPLLGVRIDYSLMTPRGHYTRTAGLRRYFAAMSVLGQTGFALPGSTAGAGGDVRGPLRVGLLATRALLGSAQRQDLWRAVYEPTSFLVGLADDYTPAEADAAVRAAAPGWPASATAIGSDATLDAVAARLTATRKVRIDPEKPSLRLMGSRFVVDSYVMDQLVDPAVGPNGAGEKRSLPSALDVAAVLGSDLARTTLAGSGATAYRGYPEQLARLTAQVADRPAGDWGGTVYDAWLYSLQPVLVRHGTAYPATMRTQAWQAKGLQSGLGSYAQLKHDTILYAKQAVAEGGGEQPAQRPRNWVEPEPAAFGRLAAAVDLLRTGLSRRSLLSGDRATLTADVSALFTRLERIARDELAGKPLAAADNQELSWIGETFESVWFRTSDVTEAEVTGDADSALIADIASGPTQVLEVGTGRFQRILVLVPDDAGHFQVAAGAVFSYYEFATPAGQRLTDESWRARLDSGDVPAAPAWAAVTLPRR